MAKKMVIIRVQGKSEKLISWGSEGKYVNTYLYNLLYDERDPKVEYYARPAQGSEIAALNKKQVDGRLPGWDNRGGALS